MPSMETFITSPQFVTGYIAVVAPIVLCVLLYVWAGTRKPR